MKRTDFKSNRPLYFGILTSTIFLFTNTIDFVPHLLKGFLAGLAIAFYGIGIYGMHHDTSKLREWKKSIFRRNKA